MHCYRVLYDTSRVTDFYQIKSLCSAKRAHTHETFNNLDLQNTFALNSNFFKKIAILDRMNVISYIYIYIYALLYIASYGVSYWSNNINH